MKTKICTSCREEKELSEFAKNKTLPGGVKELCKKCYNKRMLEYYHKIKDRPSFKEQVRKTIEKRKPKRSAYEQAKRKSDPCLAVNYNQYRRIMWEINKQKATRHYHYETLLSMAREKYYEYLLSLGYDRKTMCIDHIVPLSLFDLSTPEHQRIGCHYLNTRPLLIAENIKKRNLLQDGWENIIEDVCNDLEMNANEVIKELKKRYVEYGEQRASRKDKGRSTKYKMPVL